MADIDYRLLADYITADERAIKRASQWTLNTLAFDSQKAITENAESELDFRNNAKRALGFRIKKAKLNNLQAEIYSNRGWLYYHINEGTRHATSGLTHKGVNYLVIPIKDSPAFTKTKKLKKGFAKKAYIAKLRGRRGAMMFVRKRKGQRSIAIAYLSPQAKYKEEIDPKQTIKEQSDEKFIRLLRRGLEHNRR